MKRFWLVWARGMSPPRFEHQTFQSAHEEAMRLCLKEPNKSFVVLESIGEAAPIPTVEWEDHTK